MSAYCTLHSAEAIGWICSRATGILWAMAAHGSGWRMAMGILAVVSEHALAQQMVAGKVAQVPARQVQAPELP